MRPHVDLGTAAQSKLNQTRRALPTRFASGTKPQYRPSVAVVAIITDHQVVASGHGHFRVSRP